MDLNLQNKVAVVTGGSKGIGLAIVRTLATEGAAVVVGSRTVTEDLDSLTRSHAVTSVRVDLAEVDGPAGLIAAAVAEHGAVDILVNNVASSEPADSILDFTDDQWQRILNNTLLTAVRAVRAAVPAMHGRAGANIVNISSVNAKLPAAMIAPYRAAKAALANLNKALSEELVPTGIRINSVSPGPTRTPLWTGPGGFAHTMADQAGTTAADVMDRLVPQAMAVTTGRVNEPEEVAQLVAFLVSELAGNITGADYVIDGGMFKSVA
ncbi:MAG: SDR family oxidoreductase [Actinomycetes bacterium]